ncbi:MAG: PHP domain-containing protein [Candidatus Sigynarchaeota archaeon]
MAGNSAAVQVMEHQQGDRQHVPALVTCIVFSAITLVSLVITGSWIFFLFEILVPASYAAVSLVHFLSGIYWNRSKIEGILEMILGGLFAACSFVFARNLPPIAMASAIGFVIAFNGLWRGFFNKHYASRENLRKAIRGLLWGFSALAFLIGFPLVLDLLESWSFFASYGITFDWYAEFGEKVWYFIAATWILSMIELAIQIVSNFIQARRSSNLQAQAKQARTTRLHMTPRRLLSFSRFAAVVVILAVLFIAWMNYLLSVTSGALRNVVFYDWLSGTDVSGQYNSEIPQARYIFEPFIGISLILPFNSNPVERLPFFITIYVFARIFLFLVNDIVLINSTKRRVIMAYVEDTCKFAMKCGALVFLCLVGYAIAGYMVDGFIFLACNFEMLFHLGSYMVIFLFVGRGTYNLVVFLHYRLRISAGKADPRPRRMLYRLLHDTSMSFRREVSYFACAFILFFCVNFTMLSFNLPTHRIQASLASDEFLFDFHVHTTASDGHLTPEQRVLWYIDQGIDGAAFSDHHTPLGAIRAKEFVEKNHLDFTVIVAQEFTADADGIHLNIYGVEESLTPRGYSDPDGPNPMTIPEVIAWAKARGGFVTVNHYWGGTYTRTQLRDFGVDGFEIVNGGNFYGSTTRQFCITNGLACMAGSDMHMNYELNTFVRLRLPDPANRSTAAIFAALKGNTHQCVAISTFNYDLDDDERDLLGYYFQGLDEGQVSSWIAWSIIIFSAVIFMLAIAWRIPLKCIVDDDSST